MKRQPVASVADVPAGTLVRVMVDGTAVCIAHATDGAFHAIDDACTHEGASLSEGFLDGCEIECPMHSSVFDLRTGRVVGPPAREAARVRRVSVEGGELYVEGD